MCLRLRLRYIHERDWIAVRAIHRKIEHVEAIVTADDIVELFRLYALGYVDVGIKNALLIAFDVADGHPIGPQNDRDTAWRIVKNGRHPGIALRNGIAGVFVPKRGGNDVEYFPSKECAPARMRIADSISYAPASPGGLVGQIGG